MDFFTTRFAREHRGTECQDLYASVSSVVKNNKE